MTHAAEVEVDIWCKMAVPILGQYMTLFEMTSDPNIAEVQNIPLLKLLNDGSTRIDNAIAKLEVLKNTSYGQLITLKTMSAKIEETKNFAETWALVPSVLFGDFKNSTNQLIDLFMQYTVGGS